MIIDGKKEAALLREEIKKEISSIKENHNKTPGLSVILIGNFAPSLIYVNNKEKNSRDVGINSEVIRYSESVTEKEVLNKIDELNKKDVVNLDEERKAAMVSNLMVVLCGDKDASPVVNTGTLSH